MNIKRSVYLFGALLLITWPIGAQRSWQLGSLPAINLNKKLNKDWSLNARWESRQLVAQNHAAGKTDTGFDYLLSDFSLLGSKKMGLSNSLAAGYLIRFRANQIIHRAIQQFTIVQQQNRSRMAHRFVTDQTFEAGKSPQFRLRYRITVELPLSGEMTDPGEFYLKLNNEYLNSFQSSNYDLELRLIPQLGFGFSDTNKLEAGLDYRIRGFLDDATEGFYWITLAWFVKI